MTPTERGSTRILQVLTAVSAASIALLWLLPPVGFVAAVVLIVVLPLWGGSLLERAVVSGLVGLGLVALIFPRAGATPVTALSARLLLAVAVAALVVVRWHPRFRATGLLRPNLTDGLGLLLAVASAGWLMAAYVGRSAVDIVAALFFSGWDNHAHYTMFANTYESLSTTWPTIDGSVAWNQWYPSLHSTVWALAELATKGEGLTRPDLLWAYVQWNAVTFALCMAALGWVASDIAGRLSRRPTWARPLAFAAFAAFALLGSPAFLYNAGFTNFVLGVTVVVTAAYISARSMRSARVYGWFLVPLGSVAVLGLWTPLALGIVPSGVVVAVALVQYRRLVGVLWVVACVIGGLVLAVTQLSAILGVEPGQTAGDFTSNLGAVSIGMVPFNVGLAVASPIIAILVLVLCARIHRLALGIALAGPILAAAVVALYFARGARSVGVPLLQAYYVLKPLDGALLAVAAILAGIGATVFVRVVDGLPRATALWALAATGVVLVGALGFTGPLTKMGTGLSAAPGIQAGADRMYGIDQPLIGESIIRAQQAALPYPDATTMLWDGSGTLPNLWVASLRQVLSKTQQHFYRDLPDFPYDTNTLGYLDLTLNLNPRMTMALEWFRPSSGELLDAYVKQRNGERVVSVQVPMPPNALCPECAP
jgi:hypothetical protein